MFAKRTLWWGVVIGLGLMMTTPQLEVAWRRCGQKKLHRL
jgi:hypothetical protein